MSIGPAEEPLCDVVLRDGSTLTLRPVRQGDIASLVAFFTALSPESRYYRFFGVPNLNSATIARSYLSSSNWGGHSSVNAGDVSSRSLVTTGLPVTGTGQR